MAQEAIVSPPAHKFPCQPTYPIPVMGGIDHFLSRLPPNLDHRRNSDLGHRKPLVVFGYREPSLSGGGRPPQLEHEWDEFYTGLVRAYLNWRPAEVFTVIHLKHHDILNKISLRG